MLKIYPFNALIPRNSDKVKFILRNNIIHCSSESIYKNFSSDESIKYIIDLVGKKHLKKELNKHFYCCRIDTPELQTTGFLTLVKVNEFEKSIYAHEKNIPNKTTLYTNYFKKYNLQTSPIILAHQNIIKLKSFLNHTVENEKSIINLKQNLDNFKVCRIPDNEYFQRLFENCGVSTLFIADGHHRLSSFKQTNPDCYIMSFIVPISDVRTMNIMRKYFRITDHIKQKLFKVLEQNDLLSQQINLQIEENIDKVQIIDGKKLHVINNPNHDEVMKSSLELIDKHINYISGQLNFYNYPYTISKQHLNPNDNFSIYIPAYKIDHISDFRNIVYPPHSTMFLPKLPEGLISFQAR